MIDQYFTRSTERTGLENVGSPQVHQRRAPLPLLFGFTVVTPLTSPRRPPVIKNHAPARLTMTAKLSEGDTIAMQGEVTMIHDDGRVTVRLHAYSEVTMVHDDGSVTVRLHGYSVPITTTGEHLSSVAKRKSDPKGRKRLFDAPD